MNLARLNRLPEAEAIEVFRACCGSTAWADEMARGRPFSDAAALFAAADRHWSALGEADRLEAFSAHPRIGDVETLRTRFPQSKEAGEQAGVLTASEAVLSRLQRLNDEYLAKFGFIFLIFASGRSADEMLAALEARLPRSRAEEIRQAAAEQAGITRNRLEKLL